MQKKRVRTPKHSNSSIFPLLKDVVHTPDIQHHLIKLCIEYINTLNSQQVTAVHCSDQPIYVLCKIIQCKYPEKAEYFALFGALHIEKELLIANRHIVVTTGQKEILGDTSIDTAGLQTATVDVNHIHKARYSVQLSVLPINTCLKEAHNQVILHCFNFRGRKNVLHLVLCLCIGCRSWNSKSTTQYSLDPRENTILKLQSKFQFLRHKKTY